MQDSTASPVKDTTAPSNTTAITKSKEQILIQSSGAMIAIIVIGIILILAVILIILKTYNRKMHISRVLGANGKTKSRPKTSQTTGQSNLPLSSLGIVSVSSSITDSIPDSGTGVPIPRGEENNMETNQFDTTSGSSVVTVHSIPVDNT
ncbi:noncompact myelin-associated protein [Thalassophryne amazonica]|uniref:noncompact myelin-associated protein n=1 Tax=Thalassophryne amazonica TaxID=390379 RepID=UPI001470A138|nr:noncompact myelin-associated protein [Thalassophryne amazonica]